MSRPSLLSQEEIGKSLQTLSGWQLEGSSITKQYVFKNFAEAMQFANAVAYLAEKANHHPDIAVFGWKNVRLTLSTHDQGGLTRLDFDLATAISTIE